MSCPRCIEGTVLPGEPKGSIQQDFQGAYLASGPDSKSGNGRAVILCTDVFGMGLNNPKLLADKLADKLQCDVWIPDYFLGRPIFPVNMAGAPQRADEPMTLWAWIKLYLKLIPRIPYLIANSPGKIDSRLASFFGLLKEKKQYEKLGAVGYCFGGTTCIRLGATNLVDTVIIAHPGPFTLDQVRKIKVPVFWICAEADIFFPDSLKLESEAEFASRKGTENFVDFEFKVYKETAHGFACRPNPKFDDIMAAYDEATDDTAAWFDKILQLSTESSTTVPLQAPTEEAVLVAPV